MGKPLSIGIGGKFFIMIYGPTNDGVKWRPFKSEEGYLLTFATERIAEAFATEWKNLNPAHDYYVCSFRSKKI